MKLLNIKQSNKLIIFFSFSCAICGIIWGSVYLAYFGWTLTTFLPFSFSLIICLSALATKITGNYNILKYMQLICILFIPTLICWQLGDIANSGYVILWGFLSVIGSFFFFNINSSVIWMIAFTLNLIITIFIKPEWSSDSQKVTETFKYTFYFLNVFAPFCVIYASSWFFVNVVNENLEIVKKSTKNALKLSKRSSFYSDMYQLLLKLSTEFSMCEPGTKKELINKSLGDLGRFVNADRVYIFEYDWVKKTTSNIYEWCNSNIKAEIENLQDLPIDAIPNWYSAHQRGEYFYVPNVQKLNDPNLKAILEPQDIKSLIAIPIPSNRTNYPFGFIGFDSVREFHTYTNRERKLLTAFSLLFANLENRLRMDQILANETSKKSALLKEIGDSIRYAKRIQGTILPSIHKLKNYFDDIFILNQPRDVVSGDFYWMKEIDGRLLFAVADCTGHGVPGSLISMVCHSTLNAIAEIVPDGDPGKILDLTREQVIMKFRHTDEFIYDGMDISLISIPIVKSEELLLEGVQKKFRIDPITGKINVMWAGANIPLWLLQKDELGSLRIEEIKPDKEPIGIYHTMNPFTTQSLSIESETIIYMLTDGFKDQFGGEKSKKLTTLRARQILIETYSRTLRQQEVKLFEAFEKWRGDHDQVDDVCVAGIRLH